MSLEFEIDDEFREYLFHPDQECDKMLETSLLEEDGPRDRLIVGELPNGKRYLIDGHRRLRVCKKYNLHYDVQVLQFDDREQIKEFMDKFQLSRRNLPPNQLAIVRGRLLLEAANSCEAVAEMAKEQNVSERTAWRAKAYAEAVENLAPEIQSKVVKEMTQKDAIALSKLPVDVQIKAVREGIPPKEARPPRERLPLQDALDAANKLVAQLQNALADVHAAAKDTIRFNACKNKAREIGGQLDAWGKY